MERGLFLFIILGFTLPGSSSAAETAYQWTDDQGRIHYGDRLPASIESRKILLQESTKRQLLTCIAQAVLALVLYYRYLIF